MTEDMKKQAEKFMTIKYSIIQLKRLQKEIEEAEAERLKYAFQMDTEHQDRDTELYNTITTNQQRIKEIIESL